MRSAGCANTGSKSWCCRVSKYSTDPDVIERVRTAPREILIVDDNEDDRFMYCRLLSRHSAYTHFREAATGHDGLAEVSANRPLCILLDYQLPDMTGLEFLQRLRDRHMDVPVIMITGLDDTTVSVEALRQGADDYQVKGKITADSLPRAIDHAISRRDLQTALSAKQARLQLFYELIDRTSELLFMLRLRDDALIEINSAALSQLGYTREQSRQPGFFRQHLAAGGQASWERFIGDPSAADLRFDTEFACANGSLLPADITAHRSSIGDEDYAVIVARDVTKRRALENHLRRIGLLDGLTGLNNRRAFDERLQAEWRHAEQTREPVSLLLIDVDHFKLYNDTQGHLQGDECLRAVAGAMQDSLGREGDFLAHFGGEEFALLLRGGFEAAQAMAQKLLDAVRDAALDHPASPSSPLVSISIGAISASTASVGSAEALIKRADAALYRAKRQGRGRAVCENG